MDKPSWLDIPPSRTTDRRMILFMCPGSTKMLACLPSYNSIGERGTPSPTVPVGFRALFSLRQVPLLVGYSTVRLLSRRFSHDLPYLARWLLTHMAVNKLSRGKVAIDILQAEPDLRWVWVAYTSTDVRVNCCPWNCHIDTIHAYSGSSAMSQLTLALGQPKTLKQHLS